VPRARQSAGLLFCSGEISSLRFGTGLNGDEVSSRVFDIGYDGGGISSHGFDVGYDGGEISSSIRQAQQITRTVSVQLCRCGHPSPFRWRPRFALIPMFHDGVELFR
jgi:hypothetical protein